MTLLEPFLERVEAAPESLAVISRSARAVSYADLSIRSLALARRYREDGIGVGDRVLVLQPVGPTLYAVLIAIWRLGGVAVFPEPSAGVAGILHAARITKPKALAAPGWIRLASRAFQPLRAIPLRLPTASDDAAPCREQLAEIDRTEPALISFTSGSTGQPKPVVRSHAVLLGQHKAIVGCLPSTDPAGVDFMWFPAMALSSLALGRTVVLPNGPLRRPADVAPEKILAQISDHRAGRLFLPPAVCRSVVRRPCPVVVEEVITGGGPVFPYLVKALRSWVPTGNLHLAYGSTEAEPMAHLNADDISDDDFQAMRNGAGLLAGHPVGGAEIVLQDNEIWVTGPQVVTEGGFGDRCDQTKVLHEGKQFHRTGDAGRFDDSGRLWLLGRWSASQGDRYPFQIEVAAMEMGGVQNAAAVETCGRYILAIEGDKQQLLEWRQEISSAFDDVEVVYVPAIPVDRRHNSKADYKRLQERLLNDVRLDGDARRDRRARSRVS